MRPPRRRVWWLFGVALGVVLVVGGAVIGYLGYEKSSGPDGAVRGYFAALQASDAPRALGWGSVPDGPHTLLTSDVLRAQQRIAPIRDVAIGVVTRTGNAAVVTVSYALQFPDADLPVTSRIAVVERNGNWRLRAVALGTQILIQNAAHRATVAGGSVPGGETLLFPGALPVTFDSPYLELDPAQDSVSFGSGPVVQADVQVSAAGRAAVRDAVGLALATCLDGRPDVSCPVPDTRFVPGTLRGQLGSNVLDDLTITLGSDDDGVIEVSGALACTATYQKLTFANRAVAGRGTVELSVHAHAFAVAPLVIDWTSA